MCAVPYPQIESLEPQIESLEPQYLYSAFLGSSPSARPICSVNGSRLNLSSRAWTASTALVATLVSILAFFSTRSENTTRGPQCGVERDIFSSTFAIEDMDEPCFFVLNMTGVSKVSNRNVKICGTHEI